MSAALARWALALADFTGGNPTPALDRLDRVCDGPPGRDVMVRAIPDHVEAGVRAGDTARAGKYLPRLVDWATHTESSVAAGLLLRCRALLADDANADRLFREALRIDDCGPYDRARTRLAFGAWLRR